MSDHDDVIAKNAAWWAAHPDFMKNKPTATAKSLALSVVHWHHNVESRLRHEGKADGDKFFLRQYAIDATKAWLVEAQAELDSLGYEGPTAWYRKRDLECLVRNLQHALDTFEWNDQHKAGT